MAAADAKVSFRSVQELAINGGDELPERYIYKDSIYSRASKDDNVQAMNIPTIDLCWLKFISSSSSDSRNDYQEAERLLSALTSWGCFQVVNHGIEKSLLDKVREVAKQFFALPMDEKLKYNRAADGLEGYGNDIVFSDKQILDWNDRLLLQVRPQDKKQLKYWPQSPKLFREVLEDYTKRLQEMSEDLHKAMARSLNLEENSFLEQYGENPSMYVRLNYYPPCPRPESVLGVKAHADGSSITLLLPDNEVEGLQVQKNDKWFQVPILPYALVFNVGDQLEIMSNGSFKSLIHRAVTNSNKERISVAMFYTPDPEKEIGPVEALITHQKPRLYRNVTNYAQTNFEYYQQGKNPIEAVKL